MAEFMPIRKRKLYVVRRETHEDTFKSLYRFEFENVQWMSEHFLGGDETNRGGALSKFEKMKTFLRYVGDPGFQVGVGEDIGCHRSTVSKTIQSVMNAIVGKSKVWIKFPSNDDEMEIDMGKWREKYNFPSAIGAIDCTHIPVIKPTLHGDEYINRKRFASINVQATCNGYEEFTSVDASWPGSVHDARIWRNSEIFPILERNLVGALLLGDSGYGIAPWLMTPFSPPATQQEIVYNRSLVQERVIIERCFGQLKKRFPMLQHKLRIKLANVPTYILSCFILHNVAKRLNDEDFAVDEAEEERIGIEDIQNAYLGERVIRERGKQRRLELARVLNRMGR